MVRSTDLAPTILDLASVPAPRTMAGTSLVPWLRGARDETGLVAYAETGLWIGQQRWQTRELDFGFPSLMGMVEVNDWESTTITIKPQWLRLMIRAQHRMVRDGRWKLVATPTRAGGRLELYDVASGDDAKDVASFHPEVVLRLFRTLATWIGREDPAAWADPLPPPQRRG
jgi:arylsulfatase A-like enzyme